MNSLGYLVDGDYFHYIWFWSSDLCGPLIFLSWNASWWCSNFWVTRSYHLPLGILLARPPFKDPSTLRRLVIFYHFNWLVFKIIMCYDAYCFIPHPLIKFQAYILSFGGFLILWPLNYHFRFTMDFITLNPMDWNYTRGVTSLVVLIIHYQYLISIWWGNPKILAFHCGYQIWSLKG